MSALFFADSRLQVPLAVGSAPFNAFGRCYEVCQWSPSSYNGQTTRCVGIRAQGEKETISRFDFYAATASRYYAPVALGIWCANWETGCEALGMRGRFEVISAADRDAEGLPEVPRYDISWISADLSVASCGGVSAKWSAPSGSGSRPEPVFGFLRFLVVSIGRALTFSS